MSLILLLHGALGAEAQLEPLRTELEQRGAPAATLEFPGHGHTKINGEGFTMEAFSAHISRWLKGHAAGVHVFGYSMGGYAALLAAATGEKRILSVYTLGTRFVWTPEYCAAQVRKLDAENIRTKVPAFADTLAARHQSQPWTKVLNDTAMMMQRLAEKPLLDEQALKNAALPARLTVGELDDTVDGTETCQTAQWLPRGECHVWPQWKHPLERADTAALADDLLRFAGKA